MSKNIQNIIVGCTAFSIAGLAVYGLESSGFSELAQNYLLNQSEIIRKSMGDFIGDACVGGSYMSRTFLDGLCAVGSGVITGLPIDYFLNRKRK